MKDLYQVLDDKLAEALSNLHTITIATVTAVNGDTIDCQPVINRQVNGQSVRLPVFADVPPVFMQGGSSYTAHPITPGDYCLVLITERCYDRWYAGSDFLTPLELRMHDYSDGFALVGVNPQAGAIQIPDVITQIGDTFQQGDYVHQGNREQTGDFELNGNQEVNGDVVINGDLTVNGDINCTGTLTVPTIMADAVTVSGAVAAGTVAAGGFSGAGGAPMETDGDIIISGISFFEHGHPYSWTDPGGSGVTGGPQ